MSENNPERLKKVSLLEVSEEDAEIARLANFDMGDINLEEQDCDDNNNHGIRDSYSSLNSEAFRTKGGELGQRKRDVTANRRRVRNSVMDSNQLAAKNDEDLLHRVVKDAGLYAFGAIFVECWVLSSDGTKVTRPDGGCWMDPAFLSGLQKPEEAIKFQRSDCFEYGVGECMVGHMFSKSSISGGNRKVNWMQLRSIQANPFVIKGPKSRIKAFMEMGIGIVGAVPFKLQNRTGIVTFYTRPSADINKLRDDKNENYLKASADLIGAAFAIRIPRMEKSKFRRQQLKSAIEKIRTNIKMKGFGGLVATALAERGDSKGIAVGAGNGRPTMPGGGWVEPNFIQRRANGVAGRFSYACDNFVTLAQRSTNKWKGSGADAPVRMSLGSASYTGFCIFLIFTVLLYFDDLFASLTGEGVIFNGGWRCGTLSLMFCLTAGPPSQPRQIIAAHFYNICLGLGLRNVPYLATRMHTKKALAAALGIGGQAFLGIIHPPGNPLTFSFATMPKVNWVKILGIVLGDTIVISLAILLLNLPEKRQYPMFWLGLDWNRLVDKLDIGKPLQEFWRSLREKKEDMTSSSRSLGFEKFMSFTSERSTDGEENGNSLTSSPRSSNSETCMKSERSKWFEENCHGETCYQNEKTYDTINQSASVKEAAHRVLFAV